MPPVPPALADSRELARARAREIDFEKAISFQLSAFSKDEKAES
jgi:hypothetical protein